MPNQRTQVSIPQRVSQIDFVPTMLDLLGKSQPEQCAGRSRALLLRGEPLAPDTVFVQWNPDKKWKARKRTRIARKEKVLRALNESTRAAISPDGWKLCLRDTDKNELYNLRSDPGERHNLYDAGNQQAIIARLTGEIHRWQQKIGDQLAV
jgi:arylsulfatase A-like enzyme